MTGSVAFVGAGPGAVDLLTRAGRSALAAADVIVSDRPSLDAVIDEHAPHAERVLVGRAPGRPALDVPAIAAVLAEHHVRGDRVVRLKSGDLFVCSRAAEEIRALHELGIAVDLVPGVSAALAAPLAADRALVTGGRGSFTVVAGNDDPAYPAVDWDAVAGSPGPVVVLMGRGRQATIAEALLAGGRPRDQDVVVVHGATRGDVTVERTTLAELGPVSYTHLTLPTILRV